MDTSPNASTRSRIPRSKLPIPATALGVRPSPSRDSLRASSNTSVPRLRATASRDQLSLSRNGDLSRGSVNYTSLRGQTQGGIQRDENVRKPLGRSISNQPKPISSRAEHVTPKKPNQPRPVAAIVEDEVRSSVLRQSLSERTMETLAQLPPSPAVRRRRSSFFNPESPMRPPSQAANGSRPGSRHQTDTSMPPPMKTKTTSRPSSSAGYIGEAIPPDFCASTNSLGSRNSSFAAEIPVNHLLPAKALKTPLKTKSNANLRASVTPSKLAPPLSASTRKEKSPTLAKNGAKIVSDKSGSVTIAHRPSKPRASVGGLLRKPSMPELDRGDGTVGLGETRNLASSTTKQLVAKRVASRPPPKATNIVEEGVEQSTTPRKTSLALREQIAKAKAAIRAQNGRQSSEFPSVNPAEESSVIPAGTFDFGLAEDPFNQKVTVGGMKGLLRKRIDDARTNGRLNIAAMGLKEIPAEVMNMYNFDAINNQGGSWAESVDLTRFVAADNELEELGDDIFPDIDPQELLSDEDSKGNQFGGLETLHLHGNLLRSLPIGLRRLDLLTTLNLSNNKLEDDSFAVISQIKSLRDLKLSGNNLIGELSGSISKLENLEMLDIQRNSLTSLPDGFAELVRLKVLNLSENDFTSLHFETLHRLPLMELFAKKNRLDGTLIALRDVELPQLQILDVSVNALTSLSTDEVRLPALHQLSCSLNRLTSLPEMTSWKSLLTLAAEDNNISSIPEGFVTLPKVKNVDLTGNNLKTLEDEIGRMDSLEIFRISGNPLREKKFSSMSVEDLKRTLSARLAPFETDLAQEDTSEVFTSCPSSPTRPDSSHWAVKPGGILDRSNTQSYSLNPVIAAQVAGAHDIRVLDLRHNLFKEIPGVIKFFAPSLTTLVISHNELSSDTFKDLLDLPALKELNLASNTFSSLNPLTQHLRAPALEKLDISFNRLTSLPPLRLAFPNLTVLLASNNAIYELHPDAVRGLKVLDCSSNDIAALNARIGLLGGPGGLERLDVSGNRFRVPKYTILEKGTQATLAWLRDRIPAGEGDGDGVGDVD